VAQQAGWIDLKWHKIQRDAARAVDFDGDGQFGKEDAKMAWRRVRGVLTANLPSSAGFSAGFLVGAYAG